MMGERQRLRRLLRYGNALAALLASAAVLELLGAGLGAVPALGPAVVPDRGAWLAAAEGGDSSAIGPSPRLIVAWNGAGMPVGPGIGPGRGGAGPAWPYSLIASWWDDSYVPTPWLPASVGAGAGSRSVPAVASRQLRA